MIESKFKLPAKAEAKPKPHIFGLNDSSVTKYAALGYYVNEIAALEFEIDSFIFCVNEKQPKLAIAQSRKFPMKVSDKISFIVDTYVSLRQLRECGDIDGNLKLNFIYYSLLELFERRNSIIHGRTVFSKCDQNSFIVKVKKYGRLNKKVCVQDIQYSSWYLKNAIYDAKYFRGFLRSGMAILKGERNHILEQRRLNKEAARSRESININFWKWA